MTKRALAIVAVFGLGVGFGCAAAPLVVPRASAQQAATLTKWEYFCIHESGAANIMKAVKPLGSEGWEMVGLEGNFETVCFKRPKM
jgi:hypothetical protein